MTIDQKNRQKIYLEEDIKSLKEDILNLGNMRYKLWDKEIRFVHQGISHKDKRMLDLQKLDEKLMVAEHKLVNQLLQKLESYV